MSRQALIKFFLWNTIFGFILLSLWTVLFASSADFIYEMHSRVLFSIPRDKFDTAIYTLIGLFKILVITFYVFPLLSLLIISKRSV